MAADAMMMARALPFDSLARRGAAARSDDDDDDDDDDDAAALDVPTASGVGAALTNAVKQLPPSYLIATGVELVEMLPAEWTVRALVVRYESDS